MKKIVIVGGGFTGAATAIHLSRTASQPLQISVVEPRTDIGGGVAFSATDPDHRLNASAALHILYPEQPSAFQDWLTATGRIERDPASQAPDGTIFSRRAEFGAFMNEEFVRHTQQNPSNSIVKHIPARATGLKRSSASFKVRVDAGQPQSEIAADTVIVTINNEQPAMPQAFENGLTDHPCFTANPWNLSGLDQLADDCRVLLLGAGLTAADMVASVLRERPNAVITAISRTGIRPASRPRGVKNPMTPSEFWQRLDQIPSPMEARHGTLDTTAKILAALRADIKVGASEGIPWQIVFDDLRDSTRTLWTKLPQTEKRRCLRHLKRYYDSVRFRYPPPTEDILLAAEQRGQLSFQIGNIKHATESGAQIRVVWTDTPTGKRHDHCFDSVINCTGPATRPDQSRDPFLRSMATEKIACVAPLGLGFDTDHHCRANDDLGNANPNLFVLGALTRATFGYSIGVPFIAHQILKALPAILDA